MQRNNEAAERDAEGGAAAGAQCAGVEEEAEATQVGHGGWRGAAAGAAVELLEDLAEALAVELGELGEGVELEEGIFYVDRYALALGYKPAVRCLLVIREVCR